MLLKLTKSIEAGIKEKFCENEYSEIFTKLIDLSDDKGEKYNIIDNSDDYSYILEFKVFYLLGILVFKNSTVKNIINDKIYYLLDLLIRKSKFYAEIVEKICKNKDIISKGKIIAIRKAYTKFFEFVFFYIKADNDDKLKDLPELIALNKYINEHREDLCLIDSENDVFRWIKKETTRDN